MKQLLLVLLVGGLLVGCGEKEAEVPPFVPPAVPPVVYNEEEQAIHSMLKQAEKLNEEGLEEEQLAVLKQAYEKLDSSDVGQFTRFKTLNSYSFALLEWDKLDEARDVAQECLGAANNDEQKASALYNLGMIYSDLEQVERGIEYLERSLVIYQKTDEESLSVANSYNALGGAHHAKGDYSKSIEYYEKALAIYEEKSGEESSDGGGVLMNLGIVYSDKREYDEAIEYYEKSLAIYKKTPIVLRREATTTREGVVARTSDAW